MQSMGGWTWTCQSGTHHSEGGPGRYHRRKSERLPDGEPATWPKCGPIAMGGGGVSKRPNHNRMLNKTYTVMKPEKGVGRGRRWVRHIPNVGSVYQYANSCSKLLDERTLPSRDE
jgi:hypothetical protein